MEREKCFALKADLEGLYKDIEKGWQATGKILKKDSVRFRDRDVVQQTHTEVHADRVRKGVSHFRDLFKAAVVDLEHGQSNRMEELFTLALEVCFIQNFLDGGTNDRARAAQLMVLEYTFYGLTEEHLTAWQRILQEHMVIDPNRDLVDEYRLRNHEEDEL